MRTAGTEPAVVPAAGHREVGRIECVGEVPGIALPEARGHPLATLDLAGWQAMLADIKAARAWSQG